MALRAPDRFPLAALPTPLVRAHRLERALASPPVFLKRDDLTGFATAGNKARKLEFLLADAAARRCDVLITGGGPGSNHCQATAAAARVAGLACELVMYGNAPEVVHPNLALARSFGAEVTFTGDDDRSSVDRVLEEVAGAMKAAGRHPYVIPRGGATGLGAAGYWHAAGELTAQLPPGLAPEVVVVATGSCGTQAGLVAGSLAAGANWRVVGAAVSRSPVHCRERVLELATECAQIMGSPPPAPEDVEVVDARGPGYGLWSQAAREAADLAARSEGVILDPVFTAKAFATLLELIGTGLKQPAVFVHTGGMPSALFDRVQADSAGRKERSGPPA